MTPEFDLRAFSAAFGRRDQILREWRLFLRLDPHHTGVLEAAIFRRL